MALQRVEITNTLPPVNALPHVVNGRARCMGRPFRRETASFRAETYSVPRPDYRHVAMAANANAHAHDQSPFLCICNRLKSSKFSFRAITCHRGDSRISLRRTRIMLGYLRPAAVYHLSPSPCPQTQPQKQSTERKSAYLLINACIHRL